MRLTVDQVADLVVAGAAVAFGMTIGERAANNVLRAYENARYP